jgi:hypothetical protein
MADLIDVEQAITDLVVGALYPNGIENDSILGTACRVYRGWPSPAALGADLQAGVINVSVAPDTDPGRATTRFALSWTDERPEPSLHVSVSGHTIWFDGIAAVDQVVGLFVDGQTFVYSVRVGDSPAGIAATLAAMIRSGRPAHLVGASIAIPGAGRLVARVVVAGRHHREVRRQERDIRIICWCPTPSVRDAAAQAIDLALARYPFLPLRDGSAARVLYKGTSVYDQAQNAQLYRRDLVFMAEYPTIVSDDLPAMLFGDLRLNKSAFVA